MGRLERYVHSRHRCEVVQIGAGWAQLRHRSLSGAAAPLPAEDLVVLGVLAALLEGIGLLQVQVAVDGAAAYPQPDATGLERAVRCGSTARWQFRWTGAGAHPAAEG